MNAVELDFERAKALLIVFKTRLRSILYGAEMDHAPVISHVECTLGEWIQNEAHLRYGHLPEMQELEQLHVLIHEKAEALLHLYQTGNVAAARAGMTAIDLLADDVLQLLHHVEDRMMLENDEPEQSPVDLSGKLDRTYRELRQLHATIQELDRKISEESQRSVRAQKQAIESEKWFRNVMMQAPVGMVILRGKEMVVEMANDTYLETIGRKSDAFLGQSLYTSMPELMEAVRPVLQNVFETGVPFHGSEFEVMIHRQGEEQTCYFNFVYQPLYENDVITGIVVVATEVTSQVLSKQALQRSETQFRNLVTQSRFAKAIFKGPEMRISLANESMLTLWKKNLAEVEGKKLFDVFPELKTQRFPQLLKEVYNKAITYKENEALIYFERPEGNKNFYLDVQFAPVFEMDGSVSGIMASVNDVTEKVAFRQQISYSAERLSLATEGTKLATWDLNLQTRDIIHSARLAAIFGYPEAMLLTHQQLRDHIHPDDKHSIVEKAFDVALDTGFYQYEARLIQPDGTIRWIRTQGKILYDENRVPMRMLGTMMDITDQKSSELALKTSESKFRTLADSMPQFVWTSDTQGNFNYLNQSLYEYAGFTADRIRENGWLLLVHPNEVVESIRLWEESIRTGEDFLCEHRFRKKDGSYRWQLSRAIPQKDTNSEIQMWVGTSTDIHDSKIFIDELESKVELRTSELILANNELLRTNMELAQFAYVASHDLQEPLRKIQTFATRILETESDNLSTRGKDYFNRMQASSTRMQQLIIDLLAFSRATSVEKHYEVIDLNTVLKTVTEQLSESIIQKKAVISSVHLPTRSIILYQFEQLFTNLIANALKFAKTDTVPVIQITSGKIAGSEIELPDVNPAATYQYIAVCDNGIGFDTHFKDRIFQVFQRLHGKGTYEGTGIGLAICKKIVDNHYGLIDAVSNPGEGATFIIYLPA